MIMVQNLISFIMLSKLVSFKHLIEIHLQKHEFNILYNVIALCLIFL
jgi:hypothetical protein